MPFQSRDSVLLLYRDFVLTAIIEELERLNKHWRRSEFCQSTISNFRENREFVETDVISLFEILFTYFPCYS